MSKTDDRRWRRTSPLAAIFYLGRIFKTIAQNAVQSLAPFGAFLFAYEGDLTTRLIVGGSAFLIIVVSLSIIRYWFFRYRITEDAVLIREGVLKKSQRDIKFDRIQAINTQQNIIYRYFDLVTAQLDTAGSAKLEGYLPGIKSELAQSLKLRLQKEKKTEISDPGSNTAKRNQSGKILQLNRADMFRIGLSSNRALVILALIFPLLDRFDHLIETWVAESAVVHFLDNTGYPISSGTAVAVAGTALFALFLAIASITGAFFRYYRFDVRAEQDTLRSTGGLFTRHEHSVSVAKIQSLLAIQNPVLRFFDSFRLRAQPAASGLQRTHKQFVIPICKSSELSMLRDNICGPEFESLNLNPASRDFQAISARYIRSRTLLFGILPSSIVTACFLILIGPVALAFLLWIPMAASVSWIYYRKYGFAVSRNGVVLRQGFLGFRTIAFLHRKVQRISVIQTPLQARKGLASMRFYLASGSHRLHYIDHTMAKQLRDYILFQVESSTLAWH